MRMNRLAAVALLCGTLGVALAAPADEPKGKAGQQELDRFQGTWELVYYETNGRVVLETSLKASTRTLTVAGDRFTMTWNEGKSRNPEDWKKGKTPSYVDEVRKSGTIKLDPSADPKAIDLTYDRGEREADPWDLEGKTRRGIYRWEGDKLVVCLGGWHGSYAGERPTQFRTATVEAKALGASIETFGKR
jgi:uncharacterized protein (TIGR03067 family)